MSEPAPTVHFGHRPNKVEWVYVDNRSPQIGHHRRWVAVRPSTTVNADARISKPGHHDEHESGSQQRNAVRVTVEEAAILQGFPADFPWRGSRTAKFRQCGNAIPPPLAKAILAAVIPQTRRRR